jgi:flagellar basal-body rod protein FlgC
MSLFGGLDISASALSAERLRMDVTAENLANAQSTRTANGGPYRRKEVVLEATSDGGFAGALASARASGAAGGGGGASADAANGGVRVAGIVEDQSPNRLVYDPGNPDANAQGYVSMPNVNPVTEMVDLISASRSYEANVTAMQTSKQMFTKTLDILR